MLVTGGYDGEPEWLRGTSGYTGVLVEMNGDWATVELDDELVLEWTGPPETGWLNFGQGSAKKQGSLVIARGRWLALSHGWEDQRWEEPIGRLHVSVCAQKPDFSLVPAGGGIGAWVESHAAMCHVGDTYATG